MPSCLEMKKTGIVKRRLIYATDSDEIQAETIEVISGNVRSNQVSLYMGQVLAGKGA